MTTLDQVKKIKFAFKELARISRVLNAIDCRACNGYADTDCGRKQERSDNTKETKLENEGKLIAEGIGLKFYRQTDPRGCSVYLIDSSMNDRNYSQGIGV